jgi:hypothetical protein
LLIETRELANEIVEPAHRAGEFAQAENQKRGRRTRPEKEREMCKVAAL